MTSQRVQNFSMSVPWNLFLLTVGTVMFAFGVKAIAQPHEFVSGGLFGTAMLLSYIDNRLSIGIVYALLNIPILIMGWKFLSRRFMCYTIYSIAVASVASQFITYDAGIVDHTLAAFATGIICGAGSGIALRSLGSDGGLSVVGIILHNKYSINVGTVTIAFNAVLFALALPVVNVDNVLYSLIIAYLTSTLTNYFMGMFDQRKLIFIISPNYQDISDSILQHLGRGCTFLQGKGAFTNQEKQIILTVVHNFQLKRLEEIIYNVDPNAFIIIENTQRVLGKGFSRRKQY